jgi:hypothetical protein
MAGGARKMVFSTFAKTADGRENRRIKQDTRSILIVLFTPREVKIKALKLDIQLTNFSYFCEVQLLSKPDITKAARDAF